MRIEYKYAAELKVECLIAEMVGEDGCVMSVCMCAYFSSNSQHNSTAMPDFDSGGGGGVSSLLSRLSTIDEVSHRHQ